MPKNPRPHFLVSLDPLPAGQTYVALCGEEIRDAYWVMELDQDFGTVHLFSTINNCGKCLAKLREPSEDKARKFLYAMISGQYAITTDIS